METNTKNGQLMNMTLKAIERNQAIQGQEIKFNHNEARQKFDEFDSEVTSQLALFEYKLTMMTEHDHANPIIENHFQDNADIEKPKVSE